MIPVKRLMVLSLISLLTLTACASYKVVQMPLREADLYPLAQTREGITVAIDAIADPARAARYFGADLIKAGILPINVTVSNHGEHRSIIKPSDVMLLKGREVIDPVPVETVIRIAKSRSPWVRSKAGPKIEAFFSDLALKETVLIPHESYQGVLFFPALERKGEEDPFFTTLRIFREGGLKVRVAVTDLENGERIHFGPFTLPGIPETSRVRNSS